MINKSENPQTVDFFAYINQNFAEANFKLFILSLGVLAIIATKNIIEYKMLTK